MHKNDKNENQTKIIRCREILTIDLRNKKKIHFFSSSGFVRVGQICHLPHLEAALAADSCGVTHNIIAG